VFDVTAALLMVRTLPGGPPPERSATHSEGVARQLRNGRLVAPTVVGCSLYFSFISVFSYAAFRLRDDPFDYGTTATGLVHLVWVFGILGPPIGRLIDQRGWLPIAVARFLHASRPSRSRSRRRFRSSSPRWASSRPRRSQALPRRRSG
jgi:hypothetical protein